MPPFQAVLFDFDGVIAHTQPIMQQALWKFFREKQMAVAEGDFEKDGWATKSLVQICETLKDKYNLQLEVNYLRSQIWQTQVELINMGLESDPTLIPFLEFCKQSGIRVIIWSNSIADRVRWVIKKMGIEKYFAVVIGANDITHHKPDPEVWIKCAETLEVPVESCLVIEDGLPGLTGAKQCGAQTAYYHRFRKPEKACIELAEKSVESFSELLQTV